MADQRSHRNRRVERNELEMEIAVDRSTLRCRQSAIVEDTAVSQVAVALGVAQRLPFFQNVKSTCAWSLLDFHATQRKEAAQHIDYFKDFHAIILINEIEFGRRVNLAWYNRFIKICLEKRIGYFIERLNTLWAKADEILKICRCLARCLFQRTVGETFKLLFEGRTLGRRQIGQFIAQDPLQKALENIMCCCVRHG
jgi:hypothetical protein